ncbi:MAG: hypothetical protein ACJ76F_00820 [Bacteroidia bacterium]
MSENTHTCPRCGDKANCGKEGTADFKFRHIDITEEEEAFIRGQYAERLCGACVQQLKVRLHITKEYA